MRTRETRRAALQPASLVALRVSAGTAETPASRYPTVPPLTRRATWSVVSKLITALLLPVLALAQPTAPAASVNSAPPPSANPEAVFANPPDAAKPWVFWYWMKGAVSREGITADLEAFARVGLGGVYLVPIHDAPNPPLFEPSVRTLTPEWWAMLRHAFAEADRLNLRIALHASDGFATAGGPWITPELSMQRVTWSELHVEGGRPLALALAAPPAKENFYRDIAVLAFPTPPGGGVSTRTIVPRVTTDVPGADAQKLVVPGNTQRIRSELACRVQFEFDAPFTARSLVIRPDGRTYPVLRTIVEASDDGKTFRRVTRLVAPRHGWQDGDADYTYALPETTARFFRFVYDPADPEPGAEDLDSAKWKNAFKVQGLELSSAPRVGNYEGKSGAVWRRSDPTPADVLPAALCVDPKAVIDLTAKLSADGQLRWDAPPGRWTVLRVGHTSTGHRNDTAGAGRGLECDKLSAEAASVQFDGWLGETIRQVGADRFTRVAKYFHVDSWEAGSQNWTSDFAAEFARRRGYELTPWLPVFAGLPVASAEKSESVLLDVRRTIDDLLQERFFGTMAALARESGLAFTAETTAPTMLADDLRHFAQVDVPMGEFWLRSPTHDKPNDVHDAISGAHLYGKTVVGAEAFTELGNQWDEHPGMLKALGDRNFALGINRFVLHVAAHNPWLDRKPGMTLSNIGLFYSRDQTWFEPGKAWIDYLSRCSALLQLGAPVVDVAYFTGEELPNRAVLPERRQPALPAGFQADSINRDALLRLATVKDGRIVLPGGASYAVLVFDGGARVSPEVRRKLDELRAAGATVVDSPAADLRELFKKAKLAPDVLATDIHAAPLGEFAWTHRRHDGGDLYFVANQADAAREIVVKLRAGGRVPKFLDPVTGRESRAVRRWIVGSKETEVQFAFAPRESAFVVIGDERVTDRTHFAGHVSDTTSERPLTGSWQVRFPAASARADSTLTFPALTSWTERPEEHARTFSGTATYTTTFDWQPDGDPAVELDLGRVAELAEVRLNDRDCGTVWTPPMRVDVTRALRPGTNRLEVRVTNTWRNRLLADAAGPEAARRTFTTAALPRGDAPPLPAGLLGPVQLRASTPRPAALPVPEKLRAAVRPVSPEAMQRVYDEVKTPFKHGIVIPAEPGEMVDCPNVFRHAGRWYMMFVSIRDQVGYQTHLARSDDLLHWERLGTILPHAQTGWDAWQADGGLALYDTRWDGDHALGTHDGKFWLSYIGGAQHGYEPDPLAIGLATTNDPTAPAPWTRLPRNPVLSTFQPDVRPFESVTLYKSAIIRDEAQSLGWPFVMFYNGKTKTGNHEAIGIAVSKDLVHWTRLGAEPVVDNAPGKAAITGDPQLVRLGDVWVMFYFGFRWLEGTTAFDTFACSHDLVHWTQWAGEPLVKPSEPFDNTFAHKPWVLKHDGVVYHFYCAVGKETGRTIALATSRDLRAAAKPAETKP